MRMEIEEALAKYAELGHVVEDDSHGGISSVARTTCPICGKAMLCYQGNFYGSALEQSCDNRYFHYGWEEDESGDTYDREGERKSLITVYYGIPGDGEEYACVIHRHIGEIDYDDPVVKEKEERANNIVKALNESEKK